MIKLLDHGYIKLIEGWGSDESIIEAARMSTDKGFLGWDPWVDASGKQQPGDLKLLRYLWENKHHTPFEMGGLIIEVKAPIFVYREWHRHRTWWYNEMSARYVPLPDENYIPSVERLLLNSKTNKQAGVVAGAAELTEEGALAFQVELARMYEDQERFYQSALRAGVPKELARIDLPVGRYSKMRAGANLRNLLAFVTLRSDPRAQWEIQQYSNALGTMIQERFPRTWDLYVPKLTPSP